MSREKTGASMASLATRKSSPVSSTLGVEFSAGNLVTTSSQPLSTKFSPNTAEASTSSPSDASSPLCKFSPNTGEATTSDPTTASPPHLTPFPDLNLQTATLLARLKNPSLLSTEELQSAVAAANSTLSAWKTEWMNIEATRGRERGLKPAANVGIRPKNANTVEEENESSWEDWSDGEEALPCAKKKITEPKTSRAPFAVREPPRTGTTGTSSTAEETSEEKEKADKAARHSARMREVWANRRAEGTSGRNGGQPLPRSVERWKKMVEKKGGTHVGVE